MTTYRSKHRVCFVVTDIEADGPDPGKNSMLSIASVACSIEGQILSDFTANLAPLPDAVADSQTMIWWQDNPDAWESSTRNPQAPMSAMQGWMRWLTTLDASPVFAAHPLSFDGAWIDWYLQHCLGRRLFDRPRSPGVCHGGGLDIVSLVMGVTGRNFEQCNTANYPSEWLGGFDHSHCALDDARGYANLLARMLKGRNAYKT